MPAPCYKALQGFKRQQRWKQRSHRVVIGGFDVDVEPSTFLSVLTRWVPMAYAYETIHRKYQQRN